ncbi:MAG: hypothetical protein ACLU37_08820 [Collinsella sp.]
MAEKLIPLEDAQSIVLSHVAPTDLVESPVWQAAGFPLAEDAVADIDISPFANSAMDGYAVRAADLAAATADTPVSLSVVGHEAAGHVFEGVVGVGETVRIMTGAPVPEGADAVVKYEIVDVLDGDGNEGSHVSFSAPAKWGERSLCCRGGPCRRCCGCTPARSWSGGRGSAGKCRIREREGARCPTCGHHLAGHGTGRTE